jgi:hypothetical protein
VVWTGWWCGRDGGVDGMVVWTGWWWNTLVMIIYVSAHAKDATRWGELAK